jgi:hypothetical protein
MHSLLIRNDLFLYSHLKAGLAAGTKAEAEATHAAIQKAVFIVAILCETEVVWRSTCKRHAQNNNILVPGTQHRWKVRKAVVFHVSLFINTYVFVLSVCLKIR